MRLALLAPLLPVLAIAFAPLACTTTIIPAAVPDDDGGDPGDDGGDTTDGGTTTKDSAPPFTPGAFPGSSYPQVPNNGGGLVVNPRIVVILPSGEATVGISSFGSSFIGSATFAAVASEYGLGTATAPTPIAGPAIATQGVTSNQIESYITSTLNLAANAALRPDGKSIYLVVLPPASWILYGQANTSEQGCHENGDPNAGGVGGYHQAYGNGGDGWGVVQHCTGLVDVSDNAVLETAASHEIIEAATDVDGFSGYALPQPSNQQTDTSIWDDLLLTEIGDLCVNTSIVEGEYTYQRFWSNNAAKTKADPCIPAIPLYFNTGTTGGDTNGWTKATGASVKIPIEGFSTAALAPWIVASASGSPGPMQATEDGWAMTITGTGTVSGEATIGNGEKGSITVTVPASAQSGSFAEFELVSAAQITGENEHLWPFGVYVP